MLPITRRTFLQYGAGTVATTLLTPCAFAAPSDPCQTVALWNAPAEIRYGTMDLDAIVTTALEAATQAGAHYADVHCIAVQTEAWVMFAGTTYPIPILNDTIGFGVRALVNGYWGFAGLSGLVTVDNAAHLGRTAAMQATTASRGQSRTVQLAPTPPVRGTWTMPGIDPFTVSFAEKIDFFCALNDFIARRRYDAGAIALPSFRKDERIVASTEGTRISQITYRTGVQCALGVGPDWLTERQGGHRPDILTPAGAGWEYVRAVNIRDHVDEMLTEASRTRRPKPVDVGRYDIVFDAQAAAHLLDGSIVAATELDRAMGYLANTLGTSYLQDPVAIAGSYTIGSPLLTITTDRSMPGGAATVQWDDEGVVPVRTTLVNAGVLTDFQTTRETASWLAPYYQRTGKSTRSNGCAGTYAAWTPTSQCPPNMIITPSTEDIDFRDLVAGVKKGLAVLGGYSSMDQQQLGGTGPGDGGTVFTITDGRMDTTVTGAEYVYRSPELWKNVIAIGGPRSVRHIGIERSRGDRDVSAAYTIAAVPVAIRNVAVTDMFRKA